MHLPKFAEIFTTLATAAGTAMLMYVLLPIPQAAFIIMSILSVHELGHYVAALFAGAKPRLPIFIPLGIGALALTKVKDLKESWRGRVAMSGPLAGMSAGLAILATMISVGGVSVESPLLVVGVIALLMEIYSATLGSDGRKYRAAVLSLKQ